MPSAATTIVSHVLLGGSAILLLLAAAHDVATRTVPNWISAVLLAAGLGLRLAGGGLMLGLLAAAIVFVAAVFCWRRGWMGGADVKLLAAASLVVPPGLVLSLLLAVSLAGGILLIVSYALHVGVRRLPVSGSASSRSDGLLARIRRVERRRIRRLESLPYASAIAAGALFVLFTV